MSDFFEPTGGYKETEEVKPENNQSTQPIVEELKATPEPKIKFDFATTENIDAFLSDAKETPKQAYSSPQITTEASTDTLVNDAKAQAKNLDKAQTGAKAVVTTVDFVFQTGVQIYLDTEDEKTLEKFKTSDKEKKEMIDAWAEYLETVGWDIPPWLTIVVVMVTLYGFQVPGLIKTKKKLAIQKKQAQEVVEQKIEREKIASEVAAKQNGEDLSKAEETKKPVDYSNRRLTIVTECMNCGTELTALQIQRGGTFCSSSCSTKFRLNKLKN